jgi:ABC-type multidrug transport system fused ATPase/permease subunit
LDELEEDEPLSKKERMELEKQKQKESKQVSPKLSKKEEMLQNALAMESLNGSSDEDHAKNDHTKSEKEIKPDEQPKLSKKDLMLQKALELEALESAQENPSDSDGPTLSKKELKALKKKEEKEAAKLAEKQEKKKQKQLEMETSEPSVAAVEEEVLKDEELEEDGEGKATLEDKIRKERPPPRIRVMESSQPDYTSLRLENVGITFRNQEVLKDVTWGVQTGDRIGLVGKTALVQFRCRVCFHWSQSFVESHCRVFSYRKSITLPFLCRTVTFNSIIV